MRCGCIDIGSNTTRLLVADVADGRLTEAATAKAFTRLGAELRRTGALSPVAIEAVGTEELVETVFERSGIAIEVLTGDEEAELAFLGATRAHNGRLDGRVAVVDVGGGSCEVAVGTLAGGVEWSASLPLGSSSLAEEHLRSDPPAGAECRTCAACAEAAFASLEVPQVEHALAVGGSATSTAYLVGARIDEGSIEGALDVLRAAPADEVARRHGLEPERVRVLPAGMFLLQAAVRRLGRPLEVGRGGLREGACLRLAGR
jgi:exopolyphosphatase/guanosine-5'-triphosphate,3'-diphosphate pyrophosphatase